MLNKSLIIKLGFSPKENSSGIFIKKYTDKYKIEVDFEKETINFGGKIVFNDTHKSFQNITKLEDWVVLECINRLLEKGYNPKNIILKKTWATGHGTSGRLDILVTRDNGATYLMIECKTWGAEFNKEFKKLEKNGGQLFTYFQQDKNAEVIILYASELDGNNIKYRNEIVKIEEDYRQTASVKDFFERWNKLPKTNGIFDSWASVYEFQSKALTKKDLKVLKQEDSSFIFNRFLEILRHNVVSDKPNAFNKIFTLFLCKIVDEDRNDDEQLHFQWLEGEDNHISFQKRMTDLYRRGMKELLEKKVTDISDNEFDKQFGQIAEEDRNRIKDIFTELRLKKNNEFAIKEVYDDASFQENAKVVKEVVELLQVYQIRYNYRQQFLSDFFELLLTTGLKQESGQFFTPVPIARFIIKSLPFQEIAEQKLKKGNKKDLLPTIIDYAAGSGHFITEAMEGVQKYLEKLNPKDYSPSTRKELESWKTNQFGWAEDYVYGIEKDYRLVKTAKVSCYLHGDGLAKIIHGDGLGDFATSTEFKVLLKETDKTYPQDNKQFDIIISNPPYSVSAFKGSMMNEEKAKKAFDLYDRLTDQSKEIESLFIERTKQLLKDGGVAGIILPSTILSNTGLYTKTREIILKYFDILAITELGGATFLAAKGISTVVLFLKRRNNADWVNIQASVTKIFANLQDITINGIEKPVSKYLEKVWEDISIKDYITLLQKTPNKKIEEHEIYQEYTKKIKTKNEQEKWNSILAIEQEKLLYFIISLPQKIVLLKTGDKKEEKEFLGYEFSERRKSEGIRAIQRGKSIDDCTQLYDTDIFDNPNKASTYIYKAFSENKFDLEIPKKLKKNISYQNLVDLFTFDRSDFEKNISLSVKKKVKIESKWDIVKIGDICETSSGGTPLSGTPEFYKNGTILWVNSGEVRQGIVTNSRNKITELGLKKSSAKIFPKNTVLLAMYGATAGQVGILGVEASTNQAVCGILPSNKISSQYLFNYLKTQYENLLAMRSGVARLNISQNIVKGIKIPLPPKHIQEKIVSEVDVLEEKERKAVKDINELKDEIKAKANSLYDKYPISKLELLCENPLYGANESAVNGNPKSDYRYIRITDIDDNGNLKNDWVTANKVSDKYILKDGDFLFARSGATAGKTFLYKSKYGKALYAGYLIKFPVKQDKLKSSFLNFILKSSNYENWILSIRKGAAQPNINAQQYSSFQIPVPSLSDQQKIVSEIEAIETKINALEKGFELIPQQKEAILKKYL